MIEDYIDEKNDWDDLEQIDAEWYKYYWLVMLDLLYEELTKK